MAGVPGQGRKFDVDVALNEAMYAFWRHGFEGTSVAMLTAAMGINPPSFYSAFGGKEGAYFAAIDHYNATRGQFMARAFAEETRASALIRRLLREAASHYADQSCPGGCLVISSAVCVTPANAHVADRLRNMRNANVALLSDRIAADVCDGVLPADLDANDAAEFVGVVIQGMSQRARDGASQPHLERVATRAFDALNLTGVIDIE